jgi:hypothetical protein
MYLFCWRIECEANNTSGSSLNNIYIVQVASLDSLVLLTACLHGPNSKNFLSKQEENKKPSHATVPLMLALTVRVCGHLPSKKKSVSPFPFPWMLSLAVLSRHFGSRWGTPPPPPPSSLAAASSLLVSRSIR